MSPNFLPFCALVLGIAVGETLLLPVDKVKGQGQVQSPAIQWEWLSQHNGVISERGVTRNQALKAFRGTALINQSLGQVVTLLFDHTHAPEWVRGLSQSIELRPLEHDGFVVWQRFHNPWPVLDRDFIFRATPKYDLIKQSFTATFVDLKRTTIHLSLAEQAKVPDQTCCILGEVIHAEWQFRATGLHSTCARVEVIMDPKGWVPALFVNWFQETWPQDTLAGLREHVKTSNLDLHPSFEQGFVNESRILLTEKQCREGRMEQ